MKTYARVQDRRVVELVTTNSNIANMYHPALTWLDVTAVAGIAEGWSFDGTTFGKPVAPQLPPPELTISTLRAQLAILSAQLDNLARAS